MTMKAGRRGYWEAMDKKHPAPTAAGRRAADKPKAPPMRTLRVVARPRTVQPAWLALTRAVTEGAPKAEIQARRAAFVAALSEWERT